MSKEEILEELEATKVSVNTCSQDTILQLKRNAILRLLVKAILLEKK
jgi:hypothetical protein